jgi:hypothetical protein
MRVMKLAVLMFLLASLSVKADTVLEDVQRPGVRLRTVKLAPKEPFTMKELERRSRAELSLAKRVRFVRVLFYGINGGADLPLPTDSTFEHWKGLYESFSKSSYEVAELIAIDGNAVLRIHDSAGNVEKRVLAGKDPLVYRVGNRDYEVLYFAPAAAERYQGVGFELFVRSSAPFTRAEGVEFLTNLQRSFPETVTLVLRFRHDEWFALTDFGYPIKNPFLPYVAPPEASSSDEGMYCQRTICWVE